MILRLRPIQDHHLVLTLNNSSHIEDKSIKVHVSKAYKEREKSLKLKDEPYRLSAK